MIWSLFAYNAIDSELLVERKSFEEDCYLNVFFNSGFVFSIRTTKGEKCLERTNEKVSQRGVVCPPLPAKGTSQQRRGPLFQRPWEWLKNIPITTFTVSFKSKRILYLTSSLHFSIGFPRSRGLVTKLYEITNSLESWIRRGLVPKLCNVYMDPVCSRQVSLQV